MKEKEGKKERKMLEKGKESKRKDKIILSMMTQV